MRPHLYTPYTPQVSQFQVFYECIRNERTDGRTEPQTFTVHHVFAFLNLNARKTTLFARFYECVRDG